MNANLIAWWMAAWALAGAGYAAFLGVQMGAGWASVATMPLGAIAGVAVGLFTVIGASAAVVVPIAWRWLLMPLFAVLGIVLFGYGSAN